MSDRVSRMADGSAPFQARVQWEMSSGLSGMLTIVTSGMVVATFYFARDILVPFALAVLLAFLLAPAVRSLRRVGVSRLAAVSVTVLIAFVVILGFASIVVQEVASLGRSLPEYRDNLEAKVHALPAVIPGTGIIHRAATMLRDLRNELSRSEPSTAGGHTSGGNPSAELTKPLPVQITQPEPEPLQIIQSIIGPLLPPLAAGGLVVVFVIMILLEREDLRDRVLRLAGRGDLHRTTEAMNDAAQRISRYLLSQLVVNASCGLPIGIGLTVIGIPNPALWGIMAVALRFVPYLGIIIAASFPLALAIAVDPGWMLLVWTTLLFITVELVVAYIVEPLVFRDATGLSSVAVIAAATFWTWLWGPIGLLLSIPLTVCLVVLGHHVPQLKFLEVLLGTEPVLTPEETFYQRLLANDPEEATEQAEEFVKGRSLAEFFDEVAIPALVRAQADSDSDALAPGRRTIIKEGIRALLENLSDGEVGYAASASEHAVQPQVEIVCVAGRNELDAAAASLLVYLLRSEGYAVSGQVISADAMASNDAHRTPFADPPLICLSLLSTSSPARARYLIRRVRRQMPRAMVLVGLWGLSPAELTAAIGEIATAADIVVASLRDAVAKIDSALVSARAPGQLDSTPHPDVPRMTG